MELAFGLVAMATVAVLLIVCWKRWGRGVAPYQGKRDDANAAREVGDFTSSERLLLEAKQQAASVNSGANSAVISWDLANLYSELERWEDATTEVQFAIDAAQGDKSPYARQVKAYAPGLLIDLLKKQEKWAQLEAVLRVQLEAAKDQEKAYVLEDIAEALARQSKTKEATIALEEAIALRRLAREDEPGQLAKSLWNLGALQLEMQRFTAASKTFRELIVHSEQMNGSEQEKGYWLLAGAYGTGQSNLATGKLNEALQQFEWCLRENQTDANCLFHLALTLRQMKRFEEATARASQARKIWADEDHTKQEWATALIDQIRDESESSFLNG